MNLMDLIDAGVLIRDGYTKTNVTWDNVNFDVYVKSEMSVSDYEYVTQFDGRVIQAPSENERSYMARMVSVNIKLGENGKEDLPHDVAMKMKPSFLAALLGAIQTVQGAELEKKAAAALRQRANSRSRKRRARNNARG